MDDAKKNNWDVGLGIAAPIITVAGIIIGVWQFNMGERNKVTQEYESPKQKDRIEFKRKLWQDRVSAYHNIADIAGALAVSTDDPNEFKKQVKKFDSAYWGLMILVEDSEVDKKMRELHFTILMFKDHFAKSDQVRAKAAQLGEACRNSINAGYKLIEDESQSHSQTPKS